MERRATLFIGGQWEAPATHERLMVINPATEQLVGDVPEGREADLDRAVHAARGAFDDGSWRWLSPHRRADYMRSIAANIRTRADAIAIATTAESGVPIASTKSRAPAAAAMLDYQAGLADEFEFEEQVARKAGSGIVVHEPVGVVAAIVPWNSPLYLAIAKLAPALLAGCTVVLKPAPETPLSSYLLADAVAAAGLPEGVVSIVTAGREVGQHLVEHPDVDKVAFTGSTEAGRKIMAICAGTIKRVSLELGGKAAAVVLDDADLDTAAPTIVRNAMANNGQTCSALTRILVPAQRYDETVDALRAAMEPLTVGDPSNPATDVGPLVAERQRARVEKYIALGRQEGATVALGGGRPNGLERGWYVEPTILTDVDNEMRVAREEIFGPVIVVIAHGGDDDAVAQANDSIYGLGGAIFTADPGRGYDVARRIRTGSVALNGFPADFTLPFGGFRQSGIGREGGREAVRGYLETKSISLPAGWVPSLKPALGNGTDHVTSSAR